MKVNLISLFSQKITDSYEHAMLSLLEQCRQVIYSDGAYTGWLKSFESDTFLPVEESKFIRYFNISSSI